MILQPSSLKDLSRGLSHAGGLWEMIERGELRALNRVVEDAGYDLAKVFIGSRGTLGVMAEATFKLRPWPEAEQFVQARCESLDEAARLIGLALDSELAPVVLDLHNLSVPHSQSSTGFTLVLGFAGTREEVEWQLATSRELGVGEPSSLAYDKIFWDDGSPAQRLSCLPSR